MTQEQLKEKYEAWRKLAGLSSRDYFNLLRKDEKTVVMKLLWKHPDIGGRLKCAGGREADLAEALAGLDTRLDADELLEAARAAIQPLVSKEIIETRVNQIITEYAAHFTTKPVHSNAAEGGVRLGKLAGMDSPYLCAATLIANGFEIPLDQTKNDNTGRYQALLSVVQSDGQAKANLPEEEAATIRMAFQRIQETTGYELCHLDRVDPRLRQIAVPRDEGYVVLTPLASPGLCKLIAEQVEGIERPSWVNVDNFPVGGANPQNTMIHTQAIRSPLLFEVPTVDREIRESLGVLHGKVRIRLERDLVRLYRDWRQKHPGWTEEDTLRGRQLEKRALRPLIVQVVASLRAKHEAICELATEHGDLLDDSFRTGDGWRLEFLNAKDPLTRAVITGVWEIEAGGQLATEILNRLNDFRFGNDETLALADIDHQRLTKVISGLLEELL